MFPVSPDYLVMLTGSHTVRITVDAYYNGVRTVQDLPVTAGQVTVDTATVVPGRASITVADSGGDLVPRTMTDPLAPFGQRLLIQAQLILPDNTPVTMPLGWYRIEGAHATDHYSRYTTSKGPVNIPRGGQIELDCVDIMAELDDWRLVRPAPQPKYPGSIQAEIRELCTGAVPVAANAFTGLPDKRVPASLTYEHERLGIIDSLASELGAYPVMNRFGELTFRKINPTGAAVYQLRDGEGGTVVERDRAFTRDGLYNGVFSRSSGENEGYHALATFNTGPLRWGGPLGRIPYMHASPLITSNVSAINDAVTRLWNLRAGIYEKVTITCVPNYALDVGDLVQVFLPEGTFVMGVRSITYPLTPGPMTLTGTLPVDETKGGAA